MCLFLSDTPEKPTAALHTSPAAKMYSKSPATPRNGNPSPAAQNKALYQPGGPGGRVCICTCLFWPKEGSHSRVSVAELLQSLPVL